MTAVATKTQRAQLISAALEAQQIVSTDVDAQALACHVGLEVRAAIKDARSLASRMESGCDQQCLVLHAASLLDALPLNSLNHGTTQEAAEKIYEGMLLPLSVLRAALACDANGALNSAIKDVLTKADTANTALDSSLMQHLPAAQPEPEESDLDRSLRMPYGKASMRISECAAIVRMYLDSTTDDVRGLHALVQLLESLHVEAEAQENEALRDRACAERVQTSLCVVVDLCDALVNDNSDLVLYGVEALLAVAAEHMDSHIQELSHA